MPSAARSKKPAAGAAKPRPAAKGKPARPSRPVKAPPARKPAPKPKAPAAKPSAPKSGETAAPPRSPDARRHVLSLSFLRDGDEFMARLETDAGQITELKNRSLDQLLTLVANELEDLLE